MARSPSRADGMAGPQDRSLRPHRLSRRPGELIHIDIKRLGRFQRAGHRVAAKRIMTDNGAALRSKQSAKASRRLRIRHRRTRSCTPMTNGKV